MVNRVGEGIEESGSPVADRLVILGTVIWVLTGETGDFETLAVAPGLDVVNFIPRKP